MSDMMAAFEEELKPGGKLVGLTPPPAEKIATAREQFPDLSSKYWEFIERIGVGDAKSSGASACLPWLLFNDPDEVPDAPPEEVKRLLNFVVVSHPGASWEDCLMKTGEDTVYSYDFALHGQKLLVIADDFWAFIQGQIDYSRKADIQDEVIALEKELFSPEVRASPARMDELLDDEFEELSASGMRWAKWHMLNYPAKEEAFTFDRQNFEASMIADGLMLLKYDLTIKAPDRPPLKTRRSALWRKRGTWKALWHQATVVPPRGNRN